MKKENEEELTKFFLFDLKGTTNITISKEQEQIDSNPETSSSNRDISKFLPLLEVLVSHLPSNPKPEWTPIAGFIATYQPRPYGFEPGSFKRYVLEAENLGLIETGQVPGKEFNFWMKLKSSKEEVEELLRREKEKGKEGLFKSSKFTKVILPTLSTTNNSSRTTNTSDSVEVVDSRFYPLIKTLQELKTIKTDWGTVGEILLKNYHPRPYSPQTGGLKSHLLDAQDSGLVETGKMEGKEFDYWIKLNVSSLPVFTFLVARWLNSFFLRIRYSQIIKLSKYPPPLLRLLLQPDQSRSHSNSYP